ncbi:4-hydroxy-3-methylbut-2-enyl diphosphate reductase [Thermorudis peleae]|uniref:4-hydroxy-3-methylbut-2-enyl diphosphate reductase n=1 Tax=Thermorudis peleae TaxID=1382356 RepID=UPI0009E0950B|nr:4-hydroxy-3-methylbut-2-enyl diphosphate reductase [Thermorudis peleae]
MIDVATAAASSPNPSPSTPQPEKRIVLAPVFGFCWGVRRALTLLEQAAASGPLATVGDVIHNPQVVAALRERGIEVVGSVAEAAARGFQRVATTAHGAGPGRAQTAQLAGLTHLDLTCPLVTRVQRLAVKLVNQGYFLVVYGDATHPEVRGVLAWAGTARACAAKEPDALPWANNVAVPRKVAVISQTTKMPQAFAAFAQAVVARVAAAGGEVRIVNTICGPTRARQGAIAALADAGAELVLVVGGRKSSNTARLVEVARAAGLAAIQVEGPAEVTADVVGTARVVGVTAGASTPDAVVAAVVEQLQMLGYAPPEWPENHDDVDLDDDDA